MYCKNCGKEIADDSIYCNYCGGSQTDAKTYLHPWELGNYYESDPSADFCKYQNICKNYCPCICDQWCSFEPKEGVEPIKPIPFPGEEREKNRREGNLELFGYSERGAMNALFYNISINRDTKAFAEFLNSMGIKSEAKNVEFYMEFSLSEFGSPDLLIFATIDGKETVIFVEAKASCGKKFSLQREWERHKGFVEDISKKYNGFSSNLYYQLEMKRELFEKRNLAKEVGKLYVFGTEHKIGNNPFVLHVLDKIGECEQAFYVALVPKSDIPEYDRMEIRYVFWESIRYGIYIDKYLRPTLEFNTVDDVSQIVNEV